MRAAVAAAVPGAAVALDRRRVYVFPTRHGLTFAAALAVMLLGAINYENGLAYLLTFLLGGLMLTCILHTWRNLAGLVVGPGRAPPVFAGQTARFELLLDNRDGPLRPALTVEPQVAATHSRTTVVSVDVPARTLASVSLTLPAPRRGQLALGRVRLATRFPLGLMRAWSYVDCGPTCIVYPAPYGPLPLPAVDEEGDGQPAARGQGSEDFLGFRAYRPGDPPRSIAWKAMARGQPLQVKRFAGGSGRVYRLRYADTAALGDPERRLSQLCRWVLDGAARGATYALELPGMQIPPGSGELHRDRCLSALALHGLDGR